MNATGSPPGESLAAIAQSLEYIEAHLREEITVADMAAAAGYSLYHFIRTFDRVVLHTPYHYLMRRRISEAARELADTRRRVIDIAFDYRFNNHETFSRAFKRCFGLQPVQWRERCLIPYGALMPALTLPYLQAVHRPTLQWPQQLEVAGRMVAGLMAPLPQGDLQVISSLWASLERIWPDVAVTGKRLAIVSYADRGERFVMVGYELPSQENAPAILVTQALPAGCYVCMANTEPIDACPFLFDYLLHTWLPRFGLSPARPMEIYTWEGGNRLTVSLCVLPIHTI